MTKLLLVAVLLIVCIVQSTNGCGASARRKIKLGRRIKNHPKCCNNLRKDFIKSGISQLFKTARSIRKVIRKQKPTRKPTRFPFIVRKIKMDDPCGDWMSCPVHQRRKVKAWLQSLPGCPCYLPPYRLYDNNTLYDKVQKKTFSWKVIDSDFEMIRFFKPTADYCVRQLLDPVLSSPATQQCCYDKSFRLITRGAGAGTPNLVSPELDLQLHKKIDQEPYMLCQGDWTRYQAIRRPDNQYKCSANPRFKKFKAQVKKARDY